MITTSSRHQCSGFTLVELLVGSSVMAVILVSAYLCLHAGISGQQLIESRLDAAQNARVAIAILSADLRCACPLLGDDQFLGMDCMLGAVEADNLDFATHNYSPSAPREGDFCEVSYFLDGNQETGVFSLWRRRDPTPDSQPLSGGILEEIARGLRGLRFEYHDGFSWNDDWGESEDRRSLQPQDYALSSGNGLGMPEAIRITLWFKPNGSSSPRTALRLSSEEGAGEPPLVFQTVVHLNLAASSWLSAWVNTYSDGSNTGPEADQEKPPNKEKN